MSYSAYTPGLARLNASRFAANAPESIVFHLQTIDKRYPSLDDGASWPWLLACYEISQQVDGALVLRRRGECARPRLELTGTVEGRLGDTITLTLDDREPVFARIEIEPSAKGRVVAALYKPPQLEIEVMLADGSSKRRRLVRGSAASEFLLSPYVERADELACFFPDGDPSEMTHRVVRTLKVSVRGGGADQYEPAYKLRLLTLRGS